MNGQSTIEKEKVARKLHCQFRHPASTKLKGLLTDADVIDKELSEIIDPLDGNHEICQKFKKPKPKPIVGFPLAKHFNQTVALDFKEWSSSPKIWFLHLIDHFTRFSASCVVYTKWKEKIIKNISKIWISTFGCAIKFLLDNGGEFDNDHFISRYENLNIHICTTTAESPCSNWLIERHHAVVGYTVAKTMEDCKIDFKYYWFNHGLFLQRILWKMYMVLVQIN